MTTAKRNACGLPHPVVVPSDFACTSARPGHLDAHWAATCAWLTVCGQRRSRELGSAASESQQDRAELRVEIVTVRFAAPRPMMLASERLNDPDHAATAGPLALQAP